MRRMGPPAIIELQLPPSGHRSCRVSCSCPWDRTAPQAASAFLPVFTSSFSLLPLLLSLAFVFGSFVHCPYCAFVPRKKEESKRSDNSRSLVLSRRFFPQQTKHLSLLNSHPRRKKKKSSTATPNSSKKRCVGMLISVLFSVAYPSRRRTASQKLRTPSASRRSVSRSPPFHDLSRIVTRSILLRQIAPSSTGLLKSAQRAGDSGKSVVNRLGGLDWHRQLRQRKRPACCFCRTTGYFFFHVSAVQKGTSLTDRRRGRQTWAKCSSSICFLPSRQLARPEVSALPGQTRRVAANLAAL